MRKYQNGLKLLFIIILDIWHFLVYFNIYRCIQNILVDLLDVNKNILKYSHSSNDILYDILNAIGGQERQKIEQSRESNTSNTY